MRSFEQVLFQAGRVATITLNRPAKLNAYSEVMVREILEALADARDDGANFRDPAPHRGHRIECFVDPSVPSFFRTYTRHQEGVRAFLEKRAPQFKGR